MTPDERKEFNDLKELVRSMLLAENVQFIKALERRLDFVSSNIRLNDLLDVDISSVSDGQVLKYTTTGTDRWVNGTDNV
jgi:hypothetical protein